MHRVAPAVAAALALACGPNPATYLVALDQTGLEALPGTCYPSGNPPNPPPDVAPLVQHVFTIWEGARGRRFLEIDRVPVPFPSSAAFAFQGLAEGGPMDWTFTITADRGNGTTETRTMDFHFTDLGDTLLGSVDARAAFACTGTCTLLSCSVTMGLNGRRIEAQPTGGL